MKPSRCVDLGGEGAGDVERRLDGRRVGVGAVGRQAEPQREAAGAAREVEREVARVPLVAADHVEVRAVLGVGGAGEGRLAVHEGGAVVRREQPLVGVDAEAVGALEPAAQLGRRRRAQRRAAVGGVDVQPQPVLGADVGDRVELVDGADVRRAEVGDDGEQAVGARLRRASPAARRPSSARGRRAATSTTSTSITRAAACTEAWVSPVVAKRQRAGGVRDGLPGVVARRDERREVGGRAAADEAAAGAGREAGEPGEPLERLVLRRDRPGAALPQPAEDARRARRRGRTCWRPASARWRRRRGAAASPSAGRRASARRGTASGRGGRRSPSGVMQCSSAAASSSAGRAPHVGSFDVFRRSIA